MDLEEYLGDGWMASELLADSIGQITQDRRKSYEKGYEKEALGD